jgi:hypothetical protein
MYSNIQSLAPFSPAALDDQTREELDYALDELTELTSARQETLKKAQGLTLHDFFNKLSTEDLYEAILADPDMYKIYHAVPAGSVDHMANNLLTCPSGHITADIAARILDAPLHTKRDAIAYVKSQYHKHLDDASERWYKQEIHTKFQSTMSLCPAILNNEDDINIATQLGINIRSQYSKVFKLWDDVFKEENDQNRTDFMRSLLTTSFSELDDLSFDTVHFQRANGFYDFSSNMILLNSQMTNRFWEGALHTLAHEAQHGRQGRLMQQFDRGELEEGSAEHLQARLYKANANGGYISTQGIPDGDQQTIINTHYLAQPIERQANMMANLSSHIAGTGANQMWADYERKCSEDAAEAEKQCGNAPQRSISSLQKPCL